MNNTKSYDQLLLEKEETIELITQLTVKLHVTEKNNQDLEDVVRELEDNISQIRKGWNLEEYKSKSTEEAHQELVKRVKEIEGHLIKLGGKYKKKCQDNTDLKKRYFLLETW